MNHPTENEAEKQEELEEEHQEAVSTPPKEQPSSLLGPESRFRLLLRSASRWVLVALASFLVGIILMYAIVHRPVLVELSQAKTEIENLQADVDRLAPFEAENATLQEQADLAQQQATAAQIHATLLSIKNELLAASVALKDEDAPKAHIALSRTSENLDSLRDLLPATSKDEVDDMKLYFNLALSQLDRDRAGAIQNLDKMLLEVLTMENAMFVRP